MARKNATSFRGRWRLMDTDLWDLDDLDLVGEIYFHRGDHSGFVARREEE